MSLEPEHVVEDSDHPGAPVNARQIGAFPYGPRARVMPAIDGWKIDFFSLPDFAKEPGTTFPTLQEAIQVVLEWLPRANTEEERAKPETLKELLRLRLQEAKEVDQESSR